MIIELAGVRIITPFLGSNFIIWTSTIGIIMASLSIGYYIGGKLSDKNSSSNTLSLIIFSAGLYTLFTAFTQFPFLKFLIFYNRLNIYFASTVVSLYLFAIPSILLGIVSPYIIKLAIQQRNILISETGKIIGKFYAISTIGSIVGTFLCGFVLVVFFGLEVISFAISTFIFIASILCYLSDKISKKKVFSLILIFQIYFLLISFLFIFLSKYINTNYFKIYGCSIYSKTTPYQYLSVCDFNNENTRAVINLAQGLLSYVKKDENPIDAIIGYNKMFLSVFLEKVKKDNILILGNSVGVLTNAFVFYANENNINNMNIDAVEIDKYITEIGKKYFNLKEDRRLKIIHEDGRIYLNRMALNPYKHYDLIYWDMYSQNLIKEHLITVDTFKNINLILNKDGILVLNILAATEGLYNNFLNQVYTNLNAVFPNIKVYSFKSDESIYFSAIILAYNEETENIKQINSLLKDTEYKDVKLKNVIYTDKYAPIEKLYWNL